MPIKLTFSNFMDKVPQKKSKLHYWGIAITILYLLGIHAVIYCLSPSSLSNLSEMKLNDWGDYLAGIFGPIAFFWLILGFIQQGTELEQNTKALQLQAEELKNSVEQQTQLVIAAQKQLHLDSLRMQQEKDLMQSKIQERKPILEMSIGTSKRGNVEWVFNIQLKNHNTHPAKNLVVTSWSSPEKVVHLEC